MDNNTKAMSRALEKKEQALRKEIKTWAHVASAKFEQRIKVGAKSMILSAFQIAFDDAYGNDYDQSALIESIEIKHDDNLWPEIKCHEEVFRFMGEESRPLRQFNQNDSNLVKRFKDPSFVSNKEIRDEFFGDEIMDMQDYNALNSFTDGEYDSVTEEIDLGDSVSSGAEEVYRSRANLQTTNNGESAFTFTPVHITYSYAQKRATEMVNSYIEKELRTFVGANAVIWKNGRKK